MAIVNRIAGFASEMTEWRQHLHTIPELGRECFKTAAFVEEKLREFGVDEIQTGFATTGIVAIINGKGEGRTIGLRADFDALPIEEETGVEYASTHPGKMHACGHDVHTSSMFGVIKILNELSKKHKKQVILTTHNPFILDGLNLNDSEQRLFTVKRNPNGKTQAKRVLPNKSKTRLSEAWMSGFIGGLPKNF
jgi:metal-dependent amidase/aminoacylase/carboxypeptidase family protein